jgi:hypothetical protein
MYHSCTGLMHLSWVLVSFMVSDRLFFFMAATIFLPVYAWEFII